MKQLTRGGNIDSTVLNSNLEELSTLLAQAFAYNNQLKARQDILSNALAGALSSLNDYDSRITPDLTKYNAVFDETGAAADNHMWAGNPPHLLSQLLFNEAPGNITWINNTTIAGNALILDTDKTYSKIALIPNDFGEQIPATGTKVIIDEEEDTEWGWTLLSPDMIWCRVSDSSTMSIRAIIPPGLSPNVNHIGVQAIFPAKNTYEAWYKKVSGSLVQLTDPQGTTVHSSSQEFYFPNAKFGGEIVLNLTSSLQDAEGNYIFGLSGLTVKEDFFKARGSMIRTLDLHPLDDDLTGRYLHAIYYSGSLQAASRFSDAVRIEIGTSLTEQSDGSRQLSGVIYDTNVHPLTGIGALGINLSADTYYVKTTLITVNGITPRLEGLLFEYSNEA